MEYLPGGSLAEFIEDEDIPIGCFLRMRFCIDIASGLAYLHNMKPKQLIHGDLKAENVLLTAALDCKIGDFGSSVFSSYKTATATSESVFRQTEYTPTYAAPELLSSPSAEKTPALDTYSFSIIIYMVLKRQMPVSRYDAESLYIESIKTGQRPCLSFIDDDLSNRFDDHEFVVIKLLEEVLRQCWSHAPSDRPSMSDVHQRLLQTKLETNHVSEEVANALNQMTIMNPEQSDHQCANLNMFQPPSFQLIQPSKSILIVFIGLDKMRRIRNPWILNRELKMLVR